MRKRRIFVLCICLHALLVVSCAYETTQCLSISATEDLMTGSLTIEYVSDNINQSYAADMEISIPVTEREVTRAQNEENAIDDEIMIIYSNFSDIAPDGSEGGFASAIVQNKRVLYLHARFFRSMGQSNFIYSFIDENTTVISIIHKYYAEAFDIYNLSSVQVQLYLLSGGVLYIVDEANNVKYKATEATYDEVINRMNFLVERINSYLNNENS